MDIFFISICVFGIIVGIDSLVRVERTIPQHSSGQNLYPALILRKNTFLINDVAVPNDIVIKKKNVKKDTEVLSDTENTVIEKDVPKFKFEMFDVRWEKFNNLSISYLCPKKNKKLELEFSDKPQCTNELQVTISSSGINCGEPEDDDSREYYHIGYGIVKQRCIFSCTSNPDEEKKEIVEYSLYKSCFDDHQNFVYHVKYVLKSRNNLYHRFDEIYTEKQREKIKRRERNYEKRIAKKFNIPPHEVPSNAPPVAPSNEAHPEGEKPAEKNHLIPFQLVSHEDMILYNWKLATFNEKNYSIIWSNIAENAWKRVNEFLRTLMIKSNCNLDVYSGVHEYSEDGYPRYIWKYVRSEMKGITIIIHNHPGDGSENYPHLCEDAIHNCERYGYYANVEDTNFGYTYCCPTKNLRKIFPYFKDRFKQVKSLAFGDLCNKPSPEQSYKEISNLASSHVVERRHSAPELSQTQPKVEEKQPKVEEKQPVQKVFTNTPSMEAKVGEVRDNLDSSGADIGYLLRRAARIDTSDASSSGLTKNQNLSQESSQPAPEIEEEKDESVEKELKHKTSLDTKVEKLQNELFSQGDEDFFKDKGIQVLS